jgi:hypothetical protein
MKKASKIERIIRQQPEENQDKDNK